MSGQDEKMNGTEREEIELLLPWYAMGKLDAADRGRVERYLAANPEMRRIAEIANEEADATFAANEAIAPPGGAVLDRLLAQIEAEPRQVAKRAANGIWHRCVDWLDELAPRTLALAGAAAAALILVQAASLGALLIERQGAGAYHTASGPSSGAAKGTFALVSFTPAASAEAVTALLLENGAEIVEGPKAGGVYRIRVSTELLDAATAASRVEKLKSESKIVSFAAVSK